MKMIGASRARHLGECLAREAAILKLGCCATLLVLAPHPDDAEYYAGGTIARMIAAGARAVIVIATDGRCGSYELDSETLIRVRAEEARRGAAVLGAAPPILLGHPDTELDRLPSGHLREQFMRAIRQFKPDVVITEDPLAPDEMHPDHRAVARAAAEAIAFASLPLVHPEHLAAGLEPHFVTEKYFYACGIANANKIVDVSETLAVRIAALAEHKSQVAFLVEGVLRQARLAGLNVAEVMPEVADDPLALLTWSIQAEAAEVGRAIGVRYGEAFRYARYDPRIESLLASA